MTVRTIAHKHANMYLIGNDPYILFDCGWHDSFSVIKKALRDYGVSFERLHGLFISHFHPDHAGTVELLQRHGVRPLILERQVPYIAWLNEFFTKPKNDTHGDYVPLGVSTIIPLTMDMVSQALAECGIKGEIIYTPGHSDDSISLVVGDTAFVGDLPPYENAESYGEAVVMSWRKLIACGVKTVYPAHGLNYEI